MKKIFATVLISTALVSPFMALADDSSDDTDTTTVTPPAVVIPAETSSSGGYMDICYYEAAYSNASCTFGDTAANAQFRTDAVYRETILAPWRLAVFGPDYQ